MNKNNTENINNNKHIDKITKIIIAEICIIIISLIVSLGAIFVHPHPSNTYTKQYENVRGFQ